MKNKRKIGIGIEIECVYNSRLINTIDRGNYHDGIKVKGLNGWTAERDVTIRADDGWKIPIELVSRFTDDEDRFFKYLENFVKFFSRNGKYELSEVLNFNESCGHHVHFSIGKDFKFEDKVMYEIYLKVRNKFFRDIMKSKIESKEKILEHYGREMAIQIDDSGDWRETRYSEFNLNSERSGKGLEWRSINMLEIKTWDEFFEFWEIVYKCLEHFYDLTKKYSVLRKYAFNESIEKFDENSDFLIEIPRQIHRRNININLEENNQEVNEDVQFEYIN